MATRPTATKPVVINSPAARAKRKATATDAPGLDQTHAANVEDEGFARAYFDKLKADFKLSWTRERVIAMVLGVVTAVTSGLLLSQLVSAITIAVLATSTSAFLATLVAVLGYCIVAYGSGVLGGVVYEYVACGAAREHVGLISKTVRGWFGSKPALA
jgi:hypothetical protein